jgi:putative transposase
VLTRRISNTQKADVCIVAVNESIHLFAPPENMNTDQGSQFTSFTRIGRLKRASCRISMDGKRRFIAKIFTGHLWRSLRYEFVCRHCC